MTPCPRPSCFRALRRLLRGLLPLVAGAALLVLGACSELAYYWQAGMGQWDLLSRRRPIAEVLADPAVPDETKRRLRIVLDVQAFGTAALALPADGHYTMFADVGRPYVSWLVVAAPEFSMEAHRFCYLIVGCLGYRGYFAEADAEALAAELRAEELDAIVRPVRAYSTLGWFEDPVLSTFLAGEETRLMGTILHEQAHRRYFLEDATDFNESFAEFVEGEGVRRYLAQGGHDAALLARFEAMRVDEQRFRTLVLRGRERLVALYGSGLPAAAMRERKAALLRALREDYETERASFRLLNYDRWFAQPLNNAHLVGITQYARHLGAFQALFADSGGDFARFYAAVEDLGGLPREQREARLSELEQKTVAHANFR